MLETLALFCLLALIGVFVRLGRLIDAVARLPRNRSGVLPASAEAQGVVRPVNPSREIRGPKTLAEMQSYYFGLSCDSAERAWGGVFEETARYAAERRARD